MAIATQGTRDDLSMRITGTVAFFSNARGFGFIRRDDGGPDVFVHLTAVEASAIPGIGEGDRVSFELAPDKRGRGARAAALRKA